VFQLASVECLLLVQPRVERFTLDGHLHDLAGGIFEAPMRRLKKEDAFALLL
jgi:hypothetical protein